MVYQSFYCFEFIHSEWEPPANVLRRPWLFSSYFNSSLAWRSTYLLSFDLKVRRPHHLSVYSKPCLTLPPAYVIQIPGGQVCGPPSPIIPRGYSKYITLVWVPAPLFDLTLSVTACWVCWKHLKEIPAAENRRWRLAVQALLRDSIIYCLLCEFSLILLSLCALNRIPGPSYSTHSLSSWYMSIR